MNKSAQSRTIYFTSRKRLKASNTKYSRGSNQYILKSRITTRSILAAILILTLLTYIPISKTVEAARRWVYPDIKIISPLPNNDAPQPSTRSALPVNSIKKEIRYTGTTTITPTFTPTPTLSELTNIVAYIAEKFEPEGKAVVVRAINCFYSESGLRSNAVGHNNDTAKSTDYGVAQLNSYWHSLTEAEKTDYKANIDRAYKIYKGRGNSFSAWYGKLCN